MASIDLSNNVAIITGASSGLGQATAILFSQRGASITLCGRNRDRLDDVLKQCTEASGGHANRFITVAGDLNSCDVRNDIVDKTIAQFEKLDILVANAGIIDLSGFDIEDVTDDMFDALFNTNVKSVFFLIQSAVKHLEKSGGSIVTVSSIASKLPMMSPIIYSMTKATVDHMATCLAKDLAPRGIRVNTVNPSYVPTRILRSRFANDEEMDESARYIKTVDDANHLLHSECITAESVANSIAFMVSDSAKSITGQNIIIDNARRFGGKMTRKPEN